MSSIYYEPEKRNSRYAWIRRFFLFILLFVILGGLIYGGFFSYKIYSVGKKISLVPDKEQGSFLATVQGLTQNDPISLKSADPERINILLLGIAGKGKPGQYLTDTVMIMSIDRQTGRVALLSIPRDFYARIPGANFSTKLNSVYQYGLNNFSDQEQAAMIVTSTVTNITTLPMDYYAILNFEGFEKIIDALGGINIMNERDIYDPRYPGPNYSYETFELAKGFHHLDGATALKYARERHNDPLGDFGRAKRQQEVMQAAKNKIFSAATLLDVFKLNELFDALGENIVTNIRPEEIGSFFSLAKRLDTQNINNVVLDAWNKESLLKVSHVNLGGTRAFVLVPRVGTYSEIHELAQNIFDNNAARRRRAEIEKEDAEILILNRSSDSRLIGKIKKLLSENLNYRNVAVVNYAGRGTDEVTAVYDRTDGTKPFSLDEVATRLPAQVSYETGPPLEEIPGAQQADLVLVLGEDLVEKYNMEEGTMEDLNNQRDEEETST